MAHDHCKMHKDTTGCLITSRIRSRWECFPWWAGWTCLARSHWEDDIWQTHSLHTSLGIQNTPTQRRGHLLRITLSQRRFHCTRSAQYQPHFFTVDHHALTHTHTHTHTSFAAIGTINCGVLFKLAVTVHQCLNGRAPPYLSEHCIPVSSADTRRHVRSANRHLLAIPRFRLIKKHFQQLVR